MRKIFFLFLAIQAWVNSQDYFLSLGDLGSVRYVYDEDILLHIDRLSPSGEILYTHTYKYDNNQLVAEHLIGDLGEIVYESPGVITSPYHVEICTYDYQNHLVEHIRDGTVRKYVYNDLDELVTETSQESCEYDLAGNVVRIGQKHFNYDENNRMINASSGDYEIVYTYDELGRRTSKTVNGEKESYVHFGVNEMIVFDDNMEVKELRIPGLSGHKDLLRPIAIETNDSIYAPIHDVQGNIIKLIDIDSREEIALNFSDPFGRGLSQETPTSGIFSGKCYDKETDLVCFGNRYYSPELKRWLSPDPAHQTLDLYQYCFNNPLAYCDPDGRFVVAIPLLWMGGVALSEVLIDAAIVTGVSWIGHELIKKGNEWADKKQRDRYDRMGKEDKQAGIKPRYDGKKLGNDPTKCPGKGFEWRGKGSPESGKGNWVNPQTGEKLHPDLKHPGPKGPHWGYKGANGEQYDLFLDGTWRGQ